MKKGIIIAGAVVIAAAAAVISYKAYKNNIYWELMESNSNAKTAYNCLSEWCEDNKTDMSGIADEYRGGKIFDVSADGEGIAHYLHESMDEYNGYVYIGVGNKDGSEIVFTQWSEKKSGAVAGQYPGGVFFDDMSIDPINTSKEVKFASFYESGRSDQH